MKAKNNCSNHANHTPRPDGHIQFFSWAEKMSKTHEQTRCKDCGLWVIWIPKKELIRFEKEKNMSNLSQQEKNDMTLRELQEKLPWSIGYFEDFQNNKQEHKDFNHAILHAQKALGQLAAMSEEADHKGWSPDFPHAVKYLADLVICSLRMANTCPFKVDLQDAVINRIETKNGVKL